MILASIVSLLRGIPRNINEVVGPSTLDSLMGALMSLHKVNIDCKFSEHRNEFARLAMKKSSK